MEPGELLQLDDVTVGMKLQAKDAKNNWYDALVKKVDVERGAQVSWTRYKRSPPQWCAAGEHGQLRVPISESELTQEHEMTGYGDTTGRIGDQTYEVDAIIKKRHARGRIQYRVRWMGWGPEYDEWRPESDISDELVEAYEDEQIAAARRAARAKKMQKKQPWTVQATKAERSPIYEQRVVDAAHDFKFLAIDAAAAVHGKTQPRSEVRFSVLRPAPPFKMVGMHGRAEQVARDDLELPGRVADYVGPITSFKKGAHPVDFFSIASLDVVERMVAGVTEQSTELTDGGVLALQRNHTAMMLAPPWDVHARRKDDKPFEPTDIFVTGHRVALLEKTQADGTVKIELGLDEDRFNYDADTRRAYKEGFLKALTRLQKRAGRAGRAKAPAIDVRGVDASWTWGGAVMTDDAMYA